jgi:type I restriction enzyme, S subunit
MNAESNVPPIRFNGFSGEWEERKLLDNFEKIIDFRGRTPKKLGLDWSKTGYLALSALNVKNGYIDPNVKAHYGSQELYVKWMSGNELHKNQVLFTTEAPMGNVAQIPDNNKYILSQRTIAFEVKPKRIEEIFLAKILGATFVQKKLTSLSSGGTAQGVSQKSLSTVDVVIPKDIKEQTKIGNYFQQLDTLIAQHQKKHDKLLNLKKSLLEKMFPKQGIDDPEIRFKGFSELWEENALGDVADVYDGTHQTPQYTSSGVMFLSVENIKSLQSSKFISNECFEKDFKVFPKKNDVLMTRIGDVGTANVVESDNPKAYYVTLALLKHKDLNPYFLKNCIASDKVKKDIWHRTLHIAFPKKINMNEIVKVNIPSPKCATEQTKIGNLFKQLDTLLTQHQAQLKKLNNIRQACLEKMFVLGTKKL